MFSKLFLVFQDVINYNSDCTAFLLILLGTISITKYSQNNLIMSINILFLLFREANICEGCWIFMGIAILVLQKALEGKI